MSPAFRAKAARVALLLAGLASGCGQSAQQQSAGSPEQQKQALMEVGEMYRLACATAKRPPTKIEDCRSSQPVTPLGFQSVKDGAVVVAWGTNLSDTSEEGSTDSSEEVLAYEKKVPEEGGLVLMKNRTVKSMTAEQFKAAPKAGKG